MQNNKQNRRFSLPLVAGIVATILALGGGAAWWAKYSLDANQEVTPKPSTVTPPVVEKPTPPQPVTEQRQVEICWLNPTGDRIELVTKTVTVQKSVQADELLKIAFENLLSGTEEAYTTAIPTGTKLIDLNLDKEGVHVNLSEQFVSGGGSASMTGRLAQVLYTATSLDPDAKVWINVEGTPLNNLGGEGLIINQPMTRSDFNNNFTL